MNNKKYVIKQFEFVIIAAPGLKQFCWLLHTND